jgi:hypothetical protein
MIEAAPKQQANARKSDRDRCWGELLAIWVELGGKPHGSAAADFLRAASKPAMGSVVPTYASVVKWLGRRQGKSTKPVRRPVLRRFA